VIQLKQQCVILDLAATSKEDVLAELAAAVHHTYPQLDLSAMNRVLLEREQLGSTGIGNGVAIPHGKLSDMQQLLLCLGRSKEGINFEAVDKQPVHLVVMLLSPRSMAEEYLQALAHVSSILKDATVRNGILQAVNTREITTLFNQHSA